MVFLPKCFCGEQIYINFADPSQIKTEIGIKQSNETKLAFTTFRISPFQKEQNRILLGRMDHTSLI